VANVLFPYFADRLTLSRPQHRFLTDASKLKILNCGRYGGKSFLALIEVLWWAFWLYASRIRDRSWWRPGAIVTVGLFAPSEKNFLPLWNTLLDIVPQIPGKAPDGFNNTEIMRGEFRVFLFGFLGIQIDLISCWQPDNILGAGYDIVFVDEAARLKRPSIWFQIIKPLVIRAGYFGKVVFASTPLNNHWDQWVLSALQKKGLFANFSPHHWTPFENPRLTKDQYDEIMLERENNPENYRQEYLAELFVDIPAEKVIKGEAVWDGSMLEECYQADEVKCQGPYVAGFDIAWQGTDDAVVSVMDIPLQFACHLEVFPKTTDQDLLDIMGRTRRQWGDCEIYFDRTGGRARAFAEHIPVSLKAHPLVMRRSIDRNMKADFVVTKDVLVRAMTQRMVLGKLKLPDPEHYPFEKLPWSNEQDQEKNFGQLYREMLSLRRVTVRKADGSEEYLYRPDPVRQKDGRTYKATDNYVDGTILAVRGMPAVVAPRVSVDELERELLNNWQ
jgi:hypothetical protein